jgi:hypothetical protein
VVVRRDLAPGSQVAQGIHAAVEHALRHPQEVARAPVVAVLASASEPSLLALLSDLRAAGHQVTTFFEPDLDGALTAIATIGSDSKQLRRLPLLHARGGETNDNDGD